MAKQIKDETMLAAVFKGNGRLELEQRPVPTIQNDDDVILEVGAVGVCGSDLHILAVPSEHPAKPGVILGHEFAGRVFQVGKAVKDLKPGDHVAVDQNPPCGKCEMCRQGLPNYCIPLFSNPEPPKGWPYTPGQWWDGAMAKYVRIPSYYAYPLGKHVPMWQAAVLEPIGCVVNGMKKVNFRPGETAVVLGAGPAGLVYTSLLKTSGASKIIVSEPAALRRQAAVTCGAHVVVDPTKEDLRERVMAETNGQGADVVIDAVGRTFALALDVAANFGRVVVFGIDSRARAEVAPVTITSKELQIFGVWLMKYTMPDAIRLLEAGLLPMDKIVTHRLPLEQVLEGIELARSGKGIKVIIEPNQF
jgi:threonine dehydrogenase-like Zn-dependent dehydrogenase